MSVNQVTLVGYLGKDPEARRSTGGTAITTFSLATSEKRKGSDGQYQEETEWHRCVCFGHTAEFVTKYLGKGRLVYARGRIKTNKYTDNQGIERQSFEIVCDEVKALGKGDGQPSGGAPRTQASAQGQSQPRPTQTNNDWAPPSGTYEDNIPF